jgi:hypothetical protein
MFPRIVVRPWIVLACVLFAFARPALAQTFDFREGQPQLAVLSGQWRFQVGDNPLWAYPGFDDSHWSLLNADQSWAEQGYKGYGGLAWYRIQIELPPKHRSLAIYFSHVVDSCEVFANGHLIGHIGGTPPAPKIVTVTRAVIPIPDNDLIPGRPLMLAVRIWERPAKAPQIGGGFYPAPQIGEVQVLNEWSRTQESEMHARYTVGVVEIYSNLLTALTGFALFALRRKEREYLWWGLCQLLWAFVLIGVAYAAFEPVDFFAWSIGGSCLRLLANYFQIEFLVTLLHQRKRFVYYAAIFLILLAGTLNLINLFAASQQIGSLSTYVSFGIRACMLAFLVLAANKRDIDAWILLGPYSLFLCTNALEILVANPFLAGTNWTHLVSNFLQAPTPMPFSQLGASNIAGALEMYAVLVVLLRRYARSRRDEERLEAELEAARTVQRVLIPEEIATIPGFAVQTVYRPASQVGGDFFQIIPLEPGGALIVIGDVSGKGMPAAMTVSLLVGTFRTLAHYIHSPSEILDAMNQRMLARSKDGFTTCLVLRLDPDGTLTVANAGHLSPYLEGSELATENGLPLGLTADSNYSESTYSLSIDSQLTLLTDGVVEARNHTGELFGFQRVAEITRASAESIAQAAQKFGQEDDITVLTITRLTTVQKATMTMSSPELSPSPA